jgi:hypothetical protein
MVAIPGVVSKAIEHLNFQVRKLSESLQRDSFLRRRTVSDISVSTTAVDVSHGLSYEPEGYVVIRKSANVVVYDTAITNRKITLVASGTATISILVW